MSELKIKAGDKIRFIEDGLDVTAGKEYKVEGVYNDDIYFTDDAGNGHYWSYPSNDYEVIQESGVMDVKNLSNEELTDLIVKLSKNLAIVDKRLDTLEEREDSISNDLRTLGEEGAKTAYDVEELRSKLDEHIDMVIEDISMLDERTMHLRSMDTEDKAVEEDANEEEEEAHNAVSPSHYKYGDIEVIDYIDQVCRLYDGEQASYVANVIKYVSRSPLKNGVEDLRKARWYLDRLIDKSEQGESK